MATNRRPNNQAHTHDGPSGRRAEPDSLSDDRRRREERILDAAAALLVRWGYRKTTIDDVAREAGVGKGTIYLHWRDKRELFGATLRRASRQAVAETLRRVAADPDGGLPHRLWTHGLLAALENPLLAALMKGRRDIFEGLAGAFEPAAVQQMAGDFAEYAVRLQRAGLIRADLPVSVIGFLSSALKIGVIHTPDVLGQGAMPSMEQLTEAISDLMRRWLEPERPLGDSAMGKQLSIEWLEKLKTFEDQLQ